MRRCCPICGKKVDKPVGQAQGKSAKDERQAGFFPFCSERCKLIDLGKWFNGEYVISSPINHSQMDSNLLNADENKSCKGDNKSDAGQKNNEADRPENMLK